MEKNSGSSKSGIWKDSVTLKLVAVGVLILVLLIPSAMISNLVRERETRRNEAIGEISETWAGTQRVLGPVLTIPFRRQIKNDKGQLVTIDDMAVFLPNNLSISGSLDPDIRNRGIYDAVVYTSQLEIKGNFDRPSFSSLAVNTVDIKWEHAALTLGLSDMKGVKGITDFQWNGKTKEAAPGSLAPRIASAGFSAPINLPQSGSSQFSIKLELKGSSQLYFVPMGKETDVQILSTWKHPSFKGAFLPDERNVSADGFEAKWHASHLNRNFPQQWIGDNYGFDLSPFGVDLLQPVDHYSNTSRSTKYSILFMFLTFLVFFFIEFMNKRRLHPIQYLLVGSGIVLFYLLLLSLSEHMPFLMAYLIATVSVVTLIGGYTHGVFQNKNLTAIVSGILSALYFFLYCLLQVEDYALLIGSAGLFIALATTMYITRKIDWYQNS